MMMDLDRGLIDKAKSVYEETQEIEELLSFLKKNNITQLQSARFLIDEMSYPLREADRIVLNSQTWSEFYEANVIGREVFFSSHIEDDNEDVEPK